MLLMLLLHAVAVAGTTAVCNGLSLHGQTMSMVYLGVVAVWRKVKAVN